mmetsp:Transcript_9231/g.12751  ORF Transcript_9231/g.12751 Transcript_9231/m.12751 type:complete len:398 (+) Transcript_9231:1140-2333(+)
MSSEARGGLLVESDLGGDVSSCMSSGPGRRDKPLLDIRPVELMAVVLIDSLLPPPMLLALPLSSPPNDRDRVEASRPSSRLSANSSSSKSYLMLSFSFVSIDDMRLSTRDELLAMNPLDPSARRMSFSISAMISAMNSSLGSLLLSDSAAGRLLLLALLWRLLLILLWCDSSSFNFCFNCAISCLYDLSSVLSSTTSLMRACILMSLARPANLRVWMDSSTQRSDGDTVQMMAMCALPSSADSSRRVSLLSRKGRCWRRMVLPPATVSCLLLSSLSRWMMVESVSRLWLMCLPSLARSPLELVILAHSEPARSTRFRVDTWALKALVLSLDSMMILNNVWARELWSFISVAATWRLFSPTCSSSMTCSGLLTTCSRAPDTTVPSLGSCWILISRASL